MIAYFITSMYGTASRSAMMNEAMPMIGGDRLPPTEDIDSTPPAKFGW